MGAWVVLCAAEEPFTALPRGHQPAAVGMLAVPSLGLLAAVLGGSVSLCLNEPPIFLHPVTPSLSWARSDSGCSASTVLGSAPPQPCGMSPTPMFLQGALCAP